MTSESKDLITLVIQVSSAGFKAGNYAKITLNDVPVECHNNEHNHQRGLHIVIVNPHDGNPEFSQVFDTHASSS